MILLKPLISYLVRPVSLVRMRIAAGVGLVAIGIFCAYGYVKEGLFVLAVIVALIAAVGAGVLLKKRSAFKIARVIYCLLSVAIVSFLILPHPPGDSAHRTPGGLTFQVFVAIFGLLSLPALKKIEGE